MKRLFEYLMWFKKAVAVVALGIPAIVAQGWINDAQAAQVTGVITVLTTLLVAILENGPKPPPPDGVTFSTPPATVASLDAKAVLQEQLRQRSLMQDELDVPPNPVVPLPDEPQRE